jgi:hypothetical protein
MLMAPPPICCSGMVGISGNTLHERETMKLCDMKSCDCAQQAHMATTVLGKPALQCSECGRVTVLESPIVREAERITEAEWRNALRRERCCKFGAIMVGLYGIALYLLGGLSLVVAVVPSHPSIGVASILALSVAFIAAIKTWRAWWRRQFHVDPTPYEQSVRRTMEGAPL